MSKVNWDSLAAQHGVEPEAPEADAPQPTESQGYNWDSLAAQHGVEPDPHADLAAQLETSVPMPDDPNAGMEVPEARRPFYDRFSGIAKLGGISGELSEPLNVDSETAQSTVAAYLPALDALIKRAGPFEEPIREFLVSGAANLPAGAAEIAGLLPEMGLMAAKGLTDVTRANIADIKGDPAAANRAMLDFTDNDLADVMTEELTEYVTMPASMMEPLVTRTVPQAGKWMRDRGMSLDDFREQFRQNPLVILDLLPGVVGTMKGADIAGTKIQETLDPTPERVIPTKAPEPTKADIARLQHEFAPKEPGPVEAPTAGSQEITDLDLPEIGGPSSPLIREKPVDESVFKGMTPDERKAKETELEEAGRPGFEIPDEPVEIPVGAGPAKPRSGPGRRRRERPERAGGRREIDRLRAEEDAIFDEARSRPEFDGAESVAGLLDLHVAEHPELGPKLKDVREKIRAEETKRSTGEVDAARKRLIEEQGFTEADLNQVGALDIGTLDKTKEGPARDASIAKINDFRKKYRDPKEFPPVVDPLKKKEAAPDRGLAADDGTSPPVQPQAGGLGPAQTTEVKGRKKARAKYPDNPRAERQKLASWMRGYRDEQGQGGFAGDWGSSIIEEFGFHDKKGKPVHTRRDFDSDRWGQILAEEFPADFKNPEDAKAFLEDGIFDRGRKDIDQATEIPVDQAYEDLANAAYSAGHIAGKKGRPKKVPKKYAEVADAYEAGHDYATGDDIPFRPAKGKKPRGYPLARKPKGERPSMADAAKSIEDAAKKREASEKKAAKVEKARKKEVETGQPNMFDAEPAKRLVEEKKRADEQADFDRRQQDLFGEQPKPETPGPKKKPDDGLLFSKKGKKPQVERAEARPVAMTAKGSPDISTPEQVIRRANIVKDLESIARAPIRKGLKGVKGALGFFDTHARVIRSGKSQDIATISHEVGHALQEILFPESFHGSQKGFDPYHADRATRTAMWDELKKLGKALYGDRSPAGGYKSEGLAEFVRYWVQDRAEARKQAPKFAEEFQNRLFLDDAAAEIGVTLDLVAKNWKRHIEQSSVAKIMSVISPRGEMVKMRWTLDRLYAAFMNDEHFVDVAVHGMDPKAPESAINPSTLAKVARGHQALGELMIEEGGGIPDNKQNRFVGLIADRNMDTEGPMWPALSQGLEIDDRVVAARLEEYAEQGLVKRSKHNSPDGKDWYYLTKNGRKYMKKHTYDRLYKSLTDILKQKGVADKPLPFINEVTERFKGKIEKSKIGTRFLRRFAFRGLDSFSVYGAAKHGIERIDRGLDVGFSKADAVQAVKDLETPEMKKALGEIQVFRRHQWQMAVDEGLVKQKSVDTMFDTYDWHVPLLRVFDEHTGPGRDSRRGYAEIRQPHHFAKGSDRQIIDPIESIISETFNLANRISHARVMSSLVDYAEMHPGSGWLVELEPTRMKKVTLAFGEIRRQLKKAIQEDGKPLDADTVLDWVDPDAVLEIWRKQEKPPGMENITYYMKDGEPQWVRLDPQLYRAVKGMDAEWVHKFVRIAGAPKRWTQAGVTLNPAFFLKNIFRDGLAGAVQSNLGGANPFSGFVPGFTTKKGFQSRYMKDDHWFRWKASGAAHSAFVSLDRNYMRHNIRKLMASDRLHHRAGNVILHPLESLRILSELFEEGTRVGIFRQYIEEAGLDQNTVLQAAVKARSSTTDFNRMGYLMQLPAGLVPFLNASLQGVDKWGRVNLNAFKDAGTGLKQIATGKELTAGADATRFAVNTVTYVIAPSIAMWALWHYQGRGEEYEDIPDWKRDLYTVVPLPGEGNHAMFPKPFEHGVVYGSGTERFLTYLKNQDPDAFEGYYKSLLDAFLPGSDIAITAGTLENAKNRDNYTGRPIIPRPEQKLAASEQYGPYTSETSKLIAAGARKVPGAGKLVGTEESHAIAPRHIDNLIYSWTAGLGQEYAVPALDKAVNLMFKGTELGDDLGIGEKQTGLKRLPVVKTFIGRRTQYRQKAVDSLYDDIATSEKRYLTWISKEGDAAERYLRDPKNEKWIRSHRVYMDARTQLSNWNISRRAASKANDEPRLFEIQKEVVKLADRTKERAKNAAEDPTADRAVRLRRDLREHRSGEKGERAAFASTIETFIEEGKRTELNRYIMSLPKESRKWARSYQQRYEKRMKQSALERERSGASKRLLRKVQ